MADVAPGVSGGFFVFFLGARMVFLVENVGICLAILGGIFLYFFVISAHEHMVVFVTLKLGLHS